MGPRAAVLILWLFTETAGSERI